MLMLMVMVMIYGCFRHRLMIDFVGYLVYLIVVDVIDVGRNLLNELGLESRF